MLILTFGSAAVLGWRPAVVAWRIHSAKKSLAEGEFEAALKQLEAAEELQPESAEVLFLLARANRRADRLHQVADFLDRALAAGWDSEQIEQQRSLYLVQSGRFERAELFLQRCLRRGVEDQLAEEIYEALSKGFLKTYRIGDALFCLQYWIQWKPRSVEPRLMLASVYEQLEDAKSAVKQYRVVLEIDPERPEIHRRIADHLFSLQDLEGARDHYSQCLARDSNDVTALLGIALCERRFARTESAREKLRELLKRDLTTSQRVQVLAELADILLRDDRNPEGAIKLLIEAERLDDNSHRVNQALAIAYRKTGKIDLADSHEQKSTAIVQRLNRLATITKELLRTPKNAELRYEAGKLFMEQGMKRAGAEWLSTALIFDPQHRGARLALAEYYDETGDHAAARRHRKSVGLDK